MNILESKGIQIRRFARHLIPILFAMLLCTLFYMGIVHTQANSLEKEQVTLSRALEGGAVRTYALTGRYPQSLSELCWDYPLNDSAIAEFKLPKSQRTMSKNTLSQGPKKDYYGHFKSQDKPERLKVKAHGRDGFSIGKQDVDLRYIEQLIDSEQTQTLGALLRYAVEKLIDGKRTLPEIVELLCNKLEKEGLSFLSEGYISCGYATPRKQEIYACFNRYRRP